MENLALLVVIGLVAGVFSGLFGIGGGIVIVPALTLFLAFSAKAAVATSLAALLIPVGIFAVLAYWRRGLLDIRDAAVLTLGRAITTLVGAQITLALPDTLFKQAYGVFVLIMAVRFLGLLARPKAADPATEAPPPVGGEAPPAVAGPPALWKLFVLGLFAGLLSGMFGIGGGIVIVPALTGLFGYELKRATGTSLGSLLLPVGVFGVMRYHAEGILDIGTAVMVAAGLGFGAFAGARIAIGLDPKVMRRLYGVFLLIVGVWFVIEPYTGLTGN